MKRPSLKHKLFIDILWFLSILTFLLLISFPGRAQLISIDTSDNSDNALGMTKEPSPPSLDNKWVSPSTYRLEYHIRQGEDDFIMVILPETVINLSRDKIKDSELSELLNDKSNLSINIYLLEGKEELPDISRITFYFSEIPDSGMIGESTIFIYFGGYTVQPGSKGLLKVSRQLVDRLGIQFKPSDEYVDILAENQVNLFEPSREFNWELIKPDQPGVEEAIEHDFQYVYPFNFSGYFSFSSNGITVLQRESIDEGSEDATQTGNYDGELTLNTALGYTMAFEEENGEFLEFFNGLNTRVYLESKNTSDFDIGTFSGGIALITYPGFDRIFHNAVEDDVWPPRLRLYAESIYETADEDKHLTGADIRYGLELDWQLYFTEDTYLDTTWRYTYYPDEPFDNSSQNAFSYIDVALYRRIYEDVYVFVGYVDGTAAPIYGLDSGIKTGLRIDLAGL